MFTTSQYSKSGAWLASLLSPLSSHYCDLVLLSGHELLRLPLVLAVAASPRLAHLLADNYDHEEVCVIIPKYCHHTLAALGHLLTTGTTFSLNTKHRLELVEICTLLGFGQVPKSGQVSKSPATDVSTSYPGQGKTKTNVSEPPSPSSTTESSPSEANTQFQQQEIPLISTLDSNQNDTKKPAVDLEFNAAVEVEVTAVALSEAGIAEPSSLVSSQRPSTTPLWQDTARKSVRQSAEEEVTKEQSALKNTEQTITARSAQVGAVLKKQNVHDEVTKTKKPNTLEVQPLKRRLRAASVKASWQLEETAAEQRQKSKPSSKQLLSDKPGRKLISNPRGKVLSSVKTIPPPHMMATSSNINMKKRILPLPAQVRKPFISSVRSQSSWSDKSKSQDFREKKLKLRSKPVLGIHGKVSCQLTNSDLKVNSVGHKCAGKLELKESSSPSNLLPSVSLPSSCKSVPILGSHSQNLPHIATEEQADCTLNVGKMVTRVVNRVDESIEEVEIDIKESAFPRNVFPDPPTYKHNIRKRRVVTNTLPYSKRIKLNFPINNNTNISPPPPTYSCTECAKSSPLVLFSCPDKTSLKTHLTKVHFLHQICSQYPGTVCHLCSSSTNLTSNHLLGIHLGVTHSLCYLYIDTMFSCGICDQTIETRGKFKMHLFFHFKSKLTAEFSEIIQCPFCSYWSTKLLLRHLTLNHSLVFKYYDLGSYKALDQQTPNNSNHVLRLKHDRVNVGQDFSKTELNESTEVITLE